MTSGYGWARLVKKYWPDIFAVLLLLLTLPLFLFKLGQSSLVSWDEAWYAQTARNILLSGNLIHLTWNGTLFNDHPPAGLWFIALSFKAFGVSAFSDRLPSVIAGVASIISLYFLGKELFNRLVGFSAAVALTSCFWFLYRSRTGDLDIFLTLFFLLTLLFALKAKSNTKYLIPFSISLAFLFLTKTLVPFTIIPVLGVIFWKSKVWKTKPFLISLLAPSLVFIAWFIYQNILQPDFIQRYLSIGYPQSSPSPVAANVRTTLGFIHDGIGKWYWPTIASVLIGVLTKQKRFFLLAIFFLTFFAPFAFSNRGQLWHLIPLYPILLLAFFGFFYFLLEKIISTFGFGKIKNYLVYPLILFICFYFSFQQIKQMWYQFIDIPAYVSDEEILSREAGKFTYPFFIDGDFVPSAVFYSNKVVAQTWSGGIPGLFSDNKQFVMITKQYRLDEAKIPKSSYRVIKQDRDKILILKNG